jgi:curved DNA-binding protein CbpA
MDVLMEPDQVKKAYRKYIIKLHPDKFHADKDSSKAFLATAIFAAI